MPPHGWSRGIPLQTGRIFNIRNAPYETKGSTFAVCISTKRYDQTGLYCPILNRLLNSSHFTVKTFRRSAWTSTVSYSYPKGQHLAPVVNLQVTEKIWYLLFGASFNNWHCSFFLQVSYIKIQNMQVLKSHLSLSDESAYHAFLQNERTTLCISSC